ncbi:MAG: MBL fold metallo-hydrolase [Pseudomonadota bacterium]
MSLRYAYLGSGSRGNSAVISDGDTTVMLDCGFSLKEAERRLARLDVAPEQIDALLITHEHNDHVIGAGAFARRYGTPVYMTDGTRATDRIGDVPRCESVYFDEALSFGRIDVQPVPVPHDAREPVQFVFSAGSRRLGILTDLGYVTPMVRAEFDQCDALVVECNHDLALLNGGPYPRSLKARVSGHYGHLNNQQAAELVSQVERGRLQHVLGVHVSQKNNTTELARASLAEALDGCDIEVDVDCQSEGSPWREIY